MILILNVLSNKFTEEFQVAQDPRILPTKQGELRDTGLVDAIDQGIGVAGLYECDVWQKVLFQEHVECSGRYITLCVSVNTV